MEPFTTLTAVAAPFDIAKIDTGMIVPGRFQRIAQFADESGKALRRLALALLFLFGRQPPDRGRNGEPILSAFDDNASIGFAEPFEAETIGPVLGHWQSLLLPFIRLCKRQIPHTHFPRGGQVTNGSMLKRV